MIFVSFIMQKMIQSRMTTQDNISQLRLTRLFDKCKYLIIMLIVQVNHSQSLRVVRKVFEQKKHFKISQNLLSSQLRQDSIVDVLFLFCKPQALVSELIEYVFCNIDLLSCMKSQYDRCLLYDMLQTMFETYLSDKIWLGTLEFSYIKKQCLRDTNFLTTSDRSTQMRKYQSF